MSAIPPAFTWGFIVGGVLGALSILLLTALFFAIIIINSRGDA